MLARIEEKPYVNIILNGIAVCSAYMSANFLAGITRNYTLFDDVWMIAIDVTGIKNGLVRMKHGLDRLLIGLESYINGRGDDAARHVFLNVKSTESHRKLWENNYRHYILQNKPLTYSTYFSGELHVTND